MKGNYYPIKLAISMITTILLAMIGLFDYLGVKSEYDLVFYSSATGFVGWFFVYCLLVINRNKEIELSNTKPSVKAVKKINFKEENGGCITKCAAKESAYVGSLLCLECEYFMDINHEESWIICSDNAGQ